MIVMKGKIKTLYGVVLFVFLTLFLIDGVNAQGRPRPYTSNTTQGDAGNIGIQDNAQPGNIAPITSDVPLAIKLKNPLKVDNIQDAIRLIMNAIIKIAIPFIVVFFIWAGLKFILAQGNPEKLKEAKKMFWYTVIGTLLILGAWAITDAIVGTVNSIAS